MHSFIRLLVVLLALCLPGLNNAFAQGASDVAPGLAKAREVHAQHSRALFQNPRVVATGVGVNPAGNTVIKVYLESGTAEGLPTQLDGLPVEFTVSGRIVARRGNCNNPNANPAACQADQPSAPPGGGGATARYDRPVPIGVSTGHTNITAGTIACRVQVGCHSYALSNNHVYADEGAAAIGDDVLQPGPIDGGSAPDDVIGTLFDYEPIVFSTAASNLIDAAIIQLSADTVGAATLPDGYGLPRTEVIAAVPNMDVKKYGRTTGFTTGRVDAINVIVNVGYDSGTARFIEQIIIRPGKFSAGGDSGSLIVVDDGPDDRRPVGLLFAGSKSITIANPIQPVLDRFGAVIHGE
jgi:hypothetical protein